MKNKKSGNLLE